MNSVLVVHLALGILVAICAALLVWRKPGRRITLYLLTLQIFLGIYLLTRGIKVRPEHYTLALVAFVGYMVANAMSSRPGRERVVMVVTVISTVLVLAALVIGLKAGGMM
jgi:uncharacterized membrane protein YphA (DoxX/SURF4 family)